MDERAFDGGHRAPAENGELVVFDPHLEVLFAHAGHFHFQRVAVGGFEDGRGRREELFRRLAFTVGCDFRELKYSLDLSFLRVA